MEVDPFAIVFGDLPQLGPGSDDDTAAVLRSLPPLAGDVIVDLGCGSGRQTMVLAREIGKPVEACDLSKPFLTELESRAARAGLTDLIRVHELDMARAGERFPAIDLIWCEGAIYNVGFEEGLRSWRHWLAPEGIAVVSELCWMSESPLPETRQFFEAGYPGMKSVEENCLIASNLGYRVLSTHRLSSAAWTEGFYDILEPKCRSLLQHGESSVRELAQEMLAEIEVFRRDHDSYAYVFLVLQTDGV